MVGAALAYRLIPLQDARPILQPASHHGSSCLPRALLIGADRALICVPVMGETASQGDL